MPQPKTISFSRDHLGWINSIGHGPVLFLDALLFFRRKRDEQLAPAAITATVATPVLDRWDFDAR
jgi:hypothetical protein